jgi:hypothetical protein
MNNHFPYVLFYSIFFAGAEKKKRNQKEGDEVLITDQLH